MVLQAGHKNKVIYYGLTAIFLIAVIAAMLLQQLWLIVVPFIILAGIYLLQHPILLFYILIAAIPWSIEYNFNNSLGTDLPDEPLMLLTSLAVVILWLQQKQYRKITKLHPLLFIILLQWIWTAVTIYFSTYPVISTKFLLAKSWYLLAFVAAPLLFFQNKKVIKTTAAILLISMVAATVLAFIRHAAYGFTFENINNALHPFFRNHVNYSALLVIMLPLLIAIIALCRKNKKVYITLFVFVLAALYFSYARGAWLAAAVGLGSYWLMKKRLVVTAFLLFVFISIAALFWVKSNDRYLAFAHDYRTTIFHTDFKQHLIATYEGKDVSTAERFYRWIAGVRMIKDGWQTGFGPNTFYNNYRPYTIPAFKTWVSNNEDHSTVHNYFLLTLIEQGAMGLLLLLLLLLYAFYTAQRIYHRTDDTFWKNTVAAIAAILWMICTVNFLSDLIETDKVGSIFYLCIATLVVADQQINAVRKA